MRTIFSIWVWVYYCIVSILYYTTYGLIEPMYSKMFYLGSGVCVLFYSAVKMVKCLKGYDAIAVSMIISAVAANMMFILFYHLFGLDNFVYKICAFLFIQALTGIFVVITGTKHNLFRHEENTLH